jgi:hypothetical protein
MKVNRMGRLHRRIGFAAAVAVALALGLAALVIARAYRSVGSALTNPSAPGVAQVAEGLRSAGR